MKSNARVIFISETGKLDNYQPVPIQKRAIAERKVDLSQLRCVPGEESARFKVLGGQGRRWWHQQYYHYQVACNRFLNALLVRYPVRIAQPEDAA
ncbi:hypothetical protein [Bradyrhizobium sp. F1.13.3]|uniref:hypothetical protein n=1 Tax=Bradyrhizobium sp. F1.13.3 TaxID=3156351 RepID=UPI0033921ED9